MFFVTLAKMKGEIDPEFSKKTEEFMASPPAGIKIHKVLHTLGQYDIVILYEAPSEKVALMTAMFFASKTKTETMVAIPQEEVKNMLQTRQTQL